MFLSDSQYFSIEIRKIKIFYFYDKNIYAKLNYYYNLIFLKNFKLLFDQPYFYKVDKVICK